MKTKKILLGAIAVILTIVISIAATVAYLTDVDSEENIFTIGNVDIDLLEYERIDTETANADANVQEFHDNKPLLPAVIENGFDYTAGDTYVDWTQSAVDWKQDGENGYTSPIWDPAKINNEVDKMVFVKNTGDYSAYVRTYFAFEAGSFETFDEFQKMIHLNLNADGGWKWEWLPFPAENADGDIYFIAKATYKEALAPDNFTDITLSQIALDPTATNEHVSAFGDTYEVCVNTQAIQSAGFTDPNTALDEGFGRDIPFENLKLVAGIDLKTALHNLNGNDSTPITTKVTSVTFGLNKDHSDKVSGYEGTLTSVEQDVPVYTYYIENGSNYDLYVLADSAIYTPKDSTELFYGMSALTEVDTANMDVSRTEIMNSMFFGCVALSTLDVAKWDLRNVTDTNCMFVYCYELNGLDVSKWNVSNVTDMNSMFYDCQALTYLDVSNWNVSQSTTMRTVFYRCLKLNNLDVSSWNVSNVTDMTAMFFGCLALTSLDVDEWNVSKVTTFERFLSRIDGSNNMSIAEIDVSKWNTDSLTNMAYMFQGCDKLTSLDMSNWNVSGVTNADGVFEICEGLTTLNVSGWDVSNVETMNCIFRRCGKLTELDLSRWNTANLKITASMFKEDPSLKTIYIGDGWDVSKVSISEAMFSGCTNLKGAISYNAANANDVTYANTETGYLTYKAADSTTPEQNQ